LPTRPKIDIPVGDHVDEVSMIDYEQTKGNNKSKGDSYYRETMEGSEDEDEHGGQRVECNTH
jgi:hypothetical protein